MSGCRFLLLSHGPANEELRWRNGLSTSDLVVMPLKLDNRQKKRPLRISASGVLEEYPDDPLVGGATENWFAYMLALAFLLFRPQGLFGERIIERI